MSKQEHWNAVYGARAEEALTWFEPTAELSLQLFDAFSDKSAKIIDVGGGASRFVDGLVARGAGPITVLDLSPEALETSKTRLGAMADTVNWVAADITEWTPPSQWDFWHDRAVFHFLTERDQRAAYFRALSAGLAPGGVAIIATFAPDGPEKCSNLPVQRWSSADLAVEAEAHQPGLLHLVEGRRHVHVTPKGNLQPFEVNIFKRAE
ncbi:class I SAM-dependent methyltransferase [Marivivens marinus]|uniref:class I SAM-dependent methyltransferase n=1 Tax=Marivivens marinus TaxID=3110173 RepID=UPI003B84658A